MVLALTRLLLIWTIFLALTAATAFGQHNIALYTDSIQGKFNSAGQKTGTWIEYFDSGINKGKIKSKTKYKNGLKHGRFIEYYDDGDKIFVKRKGQYKNDKLDGTIKVYDTLGRLHSVSKWKSGKMITMKNINYG